jgi:hypothetical protein
MSRAPLRGAVAVYGRDMRDPDAPRLPSSPGFWRSPLRGPWFTSVLGLVLLVGITVLFVTGLASYAAYNPDLSPVNDKTPDKGILGFYLFAWPTDPHWLYRLNQGVHVTLGIVLIPVLLAKLWSVVPRLFALPPARSLAHALERISLLLLVGGALFEFVTGVLNVQLEYVFPGSFRSSGTTTTRRTCSWSRCSSVAPSGGRPCAPTRWRTRVPCSPCMSTVRSCPPTTVTRRGSSCPPRPVCSTPSGWPV